MIFTGKRFLLLPNTSISKLEFLCQLIRDNGGFIVEKEDDFQIDMIVLINDTYVDSNMCLTERSTFVREFELEYNMVFNYIIDHNLPCFQSRKVGEWIRNNKIQFSDNVTIEDHGKYETGPKDDEITTKSVKEDENLSENDDDTDVEWRKPPRNNLLKPELKRTELGNDSVNKKLISVIGQLARKYKIKGDRYRARSYRLAMDSIEMSPFPIKSGEQARKTLPNIGPSIAKKIQVIIDSGTLPGLETQNKSEKDIEYFANCHSIGTYTAKRWTVLNFTSFNDALANFPDVFINDWPILYGWSYFEDWSMRISLAECQTHLKVVKEELNNIDPEFQVELLGSYIRGAKDCGDIDLFFYKPGCDSNEEISAVLEKLVIQLHKQNYIKCSLQLTPTLFEIFENSINDRFKKCKLKMPPRSHFGQERIIKKYFLGVQLARNQYKPDNKSHSNTIELKEDDKFMSLSSKYTENPCRRLDFFSGKWSEIGAARMQWVGSTEFSRWIRMLATSKGYKLTQHGLFKDDLLIESFDEKKIFDILGVENVPYKDRSSGLWDRKPKNA